MPMHVLMALVAEIKHFLTLTELSMLSRLTAWCGDCISAIICAESATSGVRMDKPASTLICRPISAKDVKN